LQGTQAWEGREHLVAETIAFAQQQDLGGIEIGGGR